MSFPCVGNLVSIEGSLGEPGVPTLGFPCDDPKYRSKGVGEAPEGSVLLKTDGRFRRNREGRGGLGEVGEIPGESVALETLARSRGRKRSSRSRKCRWN